MPCLDGVKYPVRQLVVSIINGQIETHGRARTRGGAEARCRRELRVRCACGLVAACRRLLDRCDEVSTASSDTLRMCATLACCISCGHSNAIAIWDMERPSEPPIELRGTDTLRFEGCFAEGTMTDACRSFTSYHRDRRRFRRATLAVSCSQRRGSSETQSPSTGAPLAAGPPHVCIATFGHRSLRGCRACAHRRSPMISPHLRSRRSSSRSGR